jgi:hypothetical protein
MKTMKVQIKGGRVITINASKDWIYHLFCQIKRPLRITRLARRSDDTDGWITCGVSDQWSWSMFPGRREEYGVLMAQHYAQIPDVVNTVTVLPSLEWMRPFIPTNEAIKAAKA